MFEKIMKKGQGSSVSVGILSCYDTDSLCASQILMVLLFNDRRF